MISYHPASNWYQPRRMPKWTGWSGPGYSPFESWFDSATSTTSTTTTPSHAASTAQTRGRRAPAITGASPLTAAPERGAPGSGAPARSAVGPTPDALQPTLVAVRVGPRPRAAVELGRLRHHQLPRPGP